MNVSTAVLDVLGNAVINGNALTLTGQLDRKLYEATNKVLEAAGGKWNRKAKAHLFDGDAAALMDNIIVTGTVIDKAKELGYFPSPKAVVARLLELADIEPGMDCLEPSAGRGAIAVEIAKITRVDCIEIDGENVLYLSKALRVEGVRPIDPADPFVGAVVQADFLNAYPSPDPVYDRVVMNPPFAKQDDIRHVTHAHRFLKPGGKLVSVMGASVGFRTNRLTEEFRQLLNLHDGTIEKLPDNSFAESGTGVSTVIVTMTA